LTNTIADQEGEKYVKTNDCIKRTVAGVVGCLLLAASGYAQTLEKGEVEATGQVGIVTGIKTHASFAASAGKAITDRIFAQGEFGYIPLGGTSFTVPGGGPQFSSGGSVMSFMGGAQYQFSERNSFIPYAGGAVGIVRFSGSVTSTSGGTTTTADASDSDFYVSLSGGARYYVKDRWGFKPEFTIFAGDDTFFRFGVGFFYQFRR
jgi:opacity protein-like surface antigen